MHQGAAIMGVLRAPRLVEALELFERGVGVDGGVDRSASIALFFGDWCGLMCVERRELGACVP